MIRLAKAPAHILKILIDEVGKKLTDKGKNPMEFTPLADKGKNQVLSLDGPSHPSQSPRTCPNIPHELAKQACDDFSRGYCKNGSNCKLLHLYQMDNGCFMVLNPPNANDNIVPDHNLQRGSLKHLELELIELLRCRRGIPVSISSIPILYFDKYATSLHVEGRLLENRNNGEFICRMQEILAQMGSTISIVNRFKLVYFIPIAYIMMFNDQISLLTFLFNYAIFIFFLLCDRPHGRPSIVLNEDLNDISKRNDSVHGLELRVYMTFRPESVFTEQDAHNYFE